MDEYLGLAADHPASFRRYLQEHLFRLVGLDADRLRLIPGEQAERPLRTCLDYEDLLLAEPADIVCAGIGENGHLAFNDPPVADFLDPVLVKVVRLDQACRAQQLHDGCFDEHRRHADPRLHADHPRPAEAPVGRVVVPGPRKANAVLATLRGPISEACPASALRRHPGATPLPRPRRRPAGPLTGASTRVDIGCVTGSRTMTRGGYAVRWVTVATERAEGLRGFAGPIRRRQRGRSRSCRRA